MMRIITGSARGVRLDTLEGVETRPTAERVKEAVFSMLQFDIEGRRVLDLFSGSGQMALEALSRGASEAVLIDKSKNAIRIIEKNAEKCRLSSSCQIYNFDAMDYIKRNRDKKFDIIFLDPPYASGLYQPILLALYEYGILKDSSVIVCESDFNDLLADSPRLEEIYTVKKSSKYSKTVISLLEPKREVLI